MNFDTSDQNFILFEQQITEETLSIVSSGSREIVEPLEMSNQSAEDEIIIPDSSQSNDRIIENINQNTDNNNLETDETMLSGYFDSIFDPLINDNLSEPRNENEVINGLLTPIELPSSRNSLPNRDDPTIIRQQLVEINFELLETAADQAPQNQSFQLNLFDDISYTVNFGTAQISSDGESFVRVGKIEEMPLSEVILVSDKDENVVVANIRVADPLQQQDEFYQIRYQGNGIHSIREIDSSQFPECPNCGGQHPASLHQDFVVSEEQEDIDPNTPIPLGVDTPDFASNGAGVADAQMAEAEMDVMVVYSPAARDAEGGTTAMNNLITLAETETNLGYQNSQVDQRINIVHREEVAYTETASNAMSNALSELGNQIDGIIDNVHSLRDTHSADFVSLWIDTPGSCGRGYVMSNPSVGFENRAFSVVDTDCATGNFTFAHELGHNQGSQHNVEDANTSPAFSYSYGYRKTSTPNRFRTIMSYSDGTGLPRINYWSNPNVNYNGEVTGTSSANNVFSLNNTDQYASWWRVSNDHFAKAKPLSGSSASGYAFTQTATQESGEPLHGGNSGGNSAWWEWIAPSSGTVTVNTNNSDFNTTLGIYTGSSVSSLSTIASDDDGGIGTNSQVTFNATAGTTYYIAVDGYNGAFGNAIVNLNSASTSNTVDLSAANFDVIQQSLVAGNRFDIDFEIQNTEADDANGFSAGFYLSTDATIDNSANSNDILLGYEWIPNLAGNSTTGILSESLTLPDASDPFWNGNGTYYIGVISDDYNDVTETDETNNASTAQLIDYESIDITIPITDFDLSGAYFDVVQQPLDAGDNFDVDFEIQNTEAGDADGFWADFYLSTDATIDNSIGSNDILLGYEWIPNLAGNSTTGILTNSLFLPNASDPFWNGNGTYYIGVISDAFDNVVETDETNNASIGELIDYESIDITVNPSPTTTVDNDFDGDGKADIHWRNGSDNQVWLMDGTTVTTSGNPSSTTANAEGNGDFNGDGQADLLFRNGNQYEIWEMNGTTVTNTYSFTALNSNWSVVGIGDTDGDGDDDILVRNGNKNRILEIDNFNLAGVVTLNNYNASWSVAGMGDTDGDGDDDILWRKNNANRIWEIENNSRVSVNNIGGFNSSWSVVGMGDTDGDGDDDILWRKNNANRIWELEDNSRESVINIGGFNSAWQVEDVEDYDGDGDDDILFRNGNNNRVWELEDNSRVSNTNTNSLDSAWNVIA